MTQSEILSLQLGGFILLDGISLDNSIAATIAKVDKVLVTLKFDCLENHSDATVFLLDMSLKFKLECSNSPVISFPTQMHPSLDGDKRPTVRDGRPIRFVLRSSSDHLKKMETHRSMNYTIMKYVKVSGLGYGVDYLHP